ncbi:DUF1753-domain-containing protein [Trichodelitschia bisporula]|uniref:DUF1753-domain-containing protein n=1 Tax=Trichodelitschia bisporula TaxID=703511 RepID=A0A6G1HL05_9PEZI|nr:DUF1753-domain-containing protein [Trichodelitschia bisporula]
MGRLSLLKVPRPTKFLHFMSLRTGTSTILLAHVINKATGVYGILALLTGYSISSFQLSMYLYSLIALALTVYLAPHIRSQTPWHCLAFAQLYVLDTIINSLYTAVFAFTWFMVVASKDVATKIPGGKTIDNTSGFTNPQYNVSQVDVVAAPASGLRPGQDAVAVGSGTASGGQGLANVVLSPGGVMSIIIVCFFWALRVYAVLVVMAYARQVLHQSIQVSSTRNYDLHSGSKSSELAESPFEEGKEEGWGWKGKVGRFMVGLGRTYWLGRDEEDEAWMKSMGTKFRKNADQSGVHERERRRRSGTDPPRPPPGLV